MSFNKRSFSWESIINNRKNNDFPGFDKWVLNTDCYIYADTLSSNFISCYYQDKKEIRKILYDSLEENKIFVKDLTSCIKKIRDISRKNQEDPSIEDNIILLRNKWKDLSEKYFQLK